jgi:hypothetical protein
LLGGREYTLICGQIFLYLEVAPLPARFFALTGTPLGIVPKWLHYFMYLKGATVNMAVRIVLPAIAQSLQSNSLSAVHASRLS